MENLLNSRSWERLLAQVNPYFHHTLGEIQGQESYRLYSQYRKLIARIEQSTPPSSNIEIQSTEFGEAIAFQDDSQDGRVPVVEEVQEVIEELIPWRKGPYQISSHHINSEWDSSIKWNRLKPHIGNLLDSGAESVADLGCNNGYFMFRILSDFPSDQRLLVGFEPVFRNALQYLLLNSWGRSSQLVFLLLGYNGLRYFPVTFDVVLCLGILYHHPDPLGVLQLIHRSLKPGGKVVIDCQGIIGSDSLLLFPKNRYTGKRNFWFLPTLSALQNWLTRTGFTEIDIWGEYPLEENEQRTTSHAPGGSLSQGLQKSDDYYRNQKNHTSTTIEGYTSPVRIYLSARK